MEPIHRICIINEVTLDCCEDRLYWLYTNYPDAEIVVDESAVRGEMMNCCRCGVSPCCKDGFPQDGVSNDGLEGRGC